MKFAGTILYVPDVRKTLAFYEKAFGFKTRFVSETDAYGDLELGSDLILGFASLRQSKENFPGGVLKTKKTGAPPAFEIGFAVEDVAGAYARAIKAGARSVAAPTKKPWGQTVAFVKDLDGHLIELSTPWTP